MIGVNCWLRLRLHRWLAVSDQQVVTVPEDERPSKLETQILYVCERCSRPKVRTLQGSWTIEDLT